jgi:succinate dehydrogenase flavin-adding protein (antitoxin of CptAB toxin-antitoxin module)
LENLKIVEDYAQRVAQEAVKKEKEKFESELESKDENLVINLSKEGYGVKDIARIANVSVAFVNKTLSK